MTCIVGLVDPDGTVHIGGDSAGADSSWNLLVRADRKVFTIGEAPHQMALGFTDSFRMGQVLRYRLQLPPYEAGTDVARWMATAFIDAVREALKAAGFATKDKEQEHGGTFLTGFKGRLFAVYSDYQVGESIHGMHAVGCAAQVGLGVLWATRVGPDSKARILGALEAAEQFSAGVRPPFEVVSVAP